MSSLSPFETPTDQLFFSKLYESVKRIFTTQRNQWSCEEINRFLALIKVETKLETIFYEFKITGELLFDPKYLWSQVKSYITEKTYFPIMKLLYVVVKINRIENKPVQNVKFVQSSLKDQNDAIIKNYKSNLEKDDILKENNFEAKSPKFQKRSNSNTSNAKINSSETLNFEKTQKSERPYEREIFDEDESEFEVVDRQLYELSVQGDILQALEKEFKKLGESLIADLSFNQLARIFKSTEHPRAIELSELIKKYSIDGYCIVCLFADQEALLQEIKNFFTFEELTQFEEILNLILPFYYKQMLEPDSKQQIKYSIPELSGLNINFFNEKPNLNSAEEMEDIQNMSQSFGTSEMGTSEMGTSEMGTSEMGTSEMGTSEMGTSEIFGESEAGSVIESGNEGTWQYEQGGTNTRSSLASSEYHRSEMGNSVSYAHSEYDASEYGTSERGSIRESMGESVMGESIAFKEVKPKVKDVRVSSIEDTGIIQRLQEVSLHLPFNLFNMDPLQNIKINSLTYPFTINFQKPKNHKEFVQNVIKGADRLLKESYNTGGICCRDFNITGAKFGRSQQNDYRYPDELSISAKHAQIGFWNDKYQLVDLQSKTGTFLYIPMTKPLILKDEHIIQLSNQIQIVVHILKKVLLKLFCKQPAEGRIKLEFTKPENQPFYTATLKENQTLRIGRSQKSHIKLSQQSISSKHTEIKYENQEFKIYDCLSPAGTWLRLSKKGVKSEMFPLEQGDIIRISSKKAYLVKEIKNRLGQEDECDSEEEEMKEHFSDPDFKMLRQSSEDNFQHIIDTAMKRKNPYQKNNKVHYEELFKEFKE